MQPISELRKTTKLHFLRTRSSYPSLRDKVKNIVRIKAGDKCIRNGHHLYKFTLDEDRCRAESGYFRHKIRTAPYPSPYDHIHVLRDVPEKILDVAFDHLANYLNQGFYVPKNNPRCAALHGNPSDFKDMMDEKRTLTLKGNRFSESREQHEKYWRLEAAEHAYVYSIAVRTDCYNLQVMALEELKLSLNRRCRHIVLPEGEQCAKRKDSYPETWIREFKVPIDIIYKVAKVLCRSAPEDTKSELARRTGGCATDFVAQMVASRYEEMRRYPRFLCFLALEGWSFQKQVAKWMNGYWGQTLKMDLEMFMELVKQEGHSLEKMRKLLSQRRRASKKTIRFNASEETTARSLSATRSIRCIYLVLPDRQRRTIQICNNN